ncbi:Ig-like domain-containing protein [Geobacter sp. SVR]|uniref:Ig-like domain-containing protein n=1 Tax=Geobacter sp. SVR TaxID=2495594 RepID=UPI00143EFA94|nr:Ig-like domain-containing protein [Geobacter sp. SVR]BCS52567.1 hypothetical protein GSVR_08750 [Geobacter sp. SVR]GCF83995.1 hypothetical protein GSbR_05950 [Geobacter sp. SVR]
MVNLIWSGLAMIVLLSGCGWGGTPTRHNDITPLTSMQISAVSPTIAPLTSTKLSVKGNYSGLFTRDITDLATWSSDTPAIADFLTAGSPSRVTARASGTAILTAKVVTATGTVTATFSLTISSATIDTLTISPAAPTIAKGLSTQFTASGLFSDGTTQDLTFDAVWSSSAPTVASVSNDPASKGLAQALTAGTTTIAATFDGVSGTTLMTVTVPVLQSISFDPADPSLLSLSTTTLKATGHYSDGTTADITSQATWTSSRTDFATVAANGAVKTLAPGTTAISASLDGISGTTNLKVTGGILNSIALAITPNPTGSRLVLGTDARLTATGTFTNNVTRDITGAVDWSTTDAGIATVTVQGGNLALLKALAATPSITVTAESGTVSATITVNITAPSLLSLAIAPTSLTAITGISDRLTATATFSDGSTQDVTLNSTWTSDNTAAASVNNSDLGKGKVTGVAAGTALVTAALGDKSATAQVVVVARTVQRLTIFSQNQAVVSSTVASGKQVAFNLIATLNDGSTKDVTEDAVWKIDNTKIAILADSLNQPGQVVAVDGGQTTLTATLGGLSTSITVVVP